MTVLSIAIMGHPARMRHIQETQALLNYPSVACIDPHPNREVWQNAQRAYTAFAGGATHHLVLQDDLELCPNFVSLVLRLIDLLPEQVLCLYNPLPNGKKALAAGRRWIVANGVWGQAVLAPVATHIRWIRWAKKTISDAYHWGEDRRLSLYLTATNQVAYYPVPSLVQHIGNLSSTLGLNNPGKMSKCWLGAEHALDDLDWTEGLAAPLHHRYTFGADMAKFAKGAIQWE